MMENLQSSISHIWNVFVTSNMFNFTVFVAIFIILGKKFDFKAKLAGFQQKVATIIETAKNEHEEAQAKLNSAQKAVEKLPHELEVIVEEAKKNANVISEKILVEAKKQLESIEANAKKIIEAEENLMVANLTKKTSIVSLEVAKKHIEQILASNPTMHEKYINESIDELDRLNF